MNSQFGTKINNLLKRWPKGTVAVQSWLNKLGIYRQLAQVYCKNYWLTRIGHGAYIQSNDQVDWLGALYALQKRLDIKIHVGAVTALEMLGVAQYIPLSEGRKWIFVDAKDPQKIPTWFIKNFVNKDIKIVKTNLFSDCSESYTIEKDVGNFSIIAATRERAIMECLYLFPDQLSLEYINELMDNLRTLRPEVVQALLECCHSIKVKRLFLYLAETQNQPWFSKLNIKRIDLGSGSRKLGAGGFFVSKYKISIPKQFEQQGDDEYGEHL